MEALFAHADVDINHSSIVINTHEETDSCQDSRGCDRPELFTIIEDMGEEVMIGMSSDASSAAFLGPYIDTGGQRSFIGKRKQ